MAITFTRVTRSYDPTTDTSVDTTTTIQGSTLQEVRGDQKRYKALGLVETAVRTLFFVPVAYGEVPRPGDSVTWANKGYTVRDVVEIAPDGVVLAARVVVGG